MKNQVIKVLNEEHRKKVVQYWKSLGGDTKRFIGEATEEEGDYFIYYGVINGSFSCYGPGAVECNNAEIIELPITSLIDGQLQEAIKQYLKDNLKIEVKTRQTDDNYVGRVGYEVKVCIKLGEEIISESTDEITVKQTL